MLFHIFSPNNNNNNNNNNKMITVEYIFVLLSIAAIANAELVCPLFGYYHVQGACNDQCSPDADTCGTGMKCCFSPVPPCGNRCVQAKDNTPKSGRCPSSSSFQLFKEWFLCDANRCTVDDDCTAKKKCCTNICQSKVCTTPK